MKSLKTIFTLLLILICSSAVFSREITVSVGAGECFKQKMNPQIAVWLENEDGTFVRTLYVTNRASRKNWIFAPKEGRPESLPVWMHSVADASKPAAASGSKAKSFTAAAVSASSSASAKSEFDSVTSATPKGGVIFNAKLENGKAYVIKAELNNSFDYNDFYTKQNSGVNGQPSVIYSAVLPAEFSGEITLKLEGCGELNGTDGKIHPADKLTTAMKIVKCIAVTEK